MLVELTARERAELRSLLIRDLPTSYEEFQWRRRDRELGRRLSELRREWAAHRRCRPTPAA